MTRMELKQYRSICAEIQEIHIRLKEQSAHETVQGSDVEYPYIFHTVSVYGAIPSAETQRLLARENKLSVQRDEIERFIDSIDDSLTRRIFEYRYMVGGRKSWVKVAALIGGGNTPDGVRMIHDRYLIKN